jgi:hypothetical protein
LAVSLFAATARAQAWQELRGDHFIVYYETERSDFAREVLRRAESYYTRIADDLGYARYSNFWQWDRRAKIYIYPSQELFRQATGQPEWSLGSANYERKEISSYNGCVEFVEGTLAHEIAHLIFWDYVGFGRQAPLWLEEGVSKWQEPSQRVPAMYYAVQAYREGRLMSMTTLNSIDLARLQASRQPEVFYAQATSLVGFLIDRYGADRFALFCRGLRDGKTPEGALRAAYTGQIEGFEDLEKRWLDFLGRLRFVNPQDQSPKVLYKGEDP